jgi:hypothetical protein
MRQGRSQTRFPTDQPHEHHDDRGNEQEMDESAQGIGGDHSQQPADDEEEERDDF